MHYSNEKSIKNIEKKLNIGYNSKKGGVNILAVT